MIGSWSDVEYREAMAELLAESFYPAVGCRLSRWTSPVGSRLTGREMKDVWRLRFFLAVFFAFYRLGPLQIVDDEVISQAG